MQTSSFKLRLIAVAALATVGLSSCSQAPDSETTALVSGVVSKGIIIGAKIYAYPIINGIVVKATPLGQATTNPDGKYTIAFQTITGQWQLSPPQQPMVHQK